MLGDPSRTTAWQLGDGCKTWTTSSMGSTKAGGLSQFAIGASLEQPSSWKQWRSLSLTMDLGSDGVSASNVLTYFSEVQLNVVQLPDPSHGCNRRIEHALVKSQLKGMWMLMMAS